MFWNNDADILLQFLFLRRSLVRVQVKRPIDWASFLVLATNWHGHSTESLLGW